MSSPSSPPSIRLDSREEALFSKVLACLSALNLPVSVRVAGGWVRDKLLGLSSADIDFALDHMTGAQFAAAVQSYLESRGESTSSIGVIKLNPEQSKHLETATFKVDGISIDCNNFRKEIYHEDSRIPDIELSSAQEDALRRDFTVNSLFYNIATREVEDYCGGLQDFAQRRLRTPRPPQQTFLDDPLRVLRAARFAGRFQFSVDPAIEQAAKSARIQEAIKKKITRERIGQEIQKILDKPYSAVFSLGYLYRWGLRSIVFQLSETVQKFASEELEGVDRVKLCPIENEAAAGSETPAITERCLAALEFAHLLRLQRFAPSSEFGLFTPALPSASFDSLFDSLYSSNPGAAALLILSCCHHPYFGFKSPVAKGRSLSLVQFIIRHSLKLPIRESDQVWETILCAQQIRKIAAEYSKCAGEPDDSSARDRVLLSSARSIRAMKALFFVSFDIARILVALDGDAAEESAMMRYQEFIVHQSPLVSQRVWELKPLLNGRDLQIALGVPPGPQLAQMLEWTLEWQIRHLHLNLNTETAKQEIIQQIKNNRSSSIAEPRGKQ